MEEKVKVDKEKKNNSENDFPGLEHEFFVLKLGVNNNKMRQFTNETVQEWIDNLNNKVVPYYKIEYAINLKEVDVKFNFIDSTLFCGIVYALEIRDGSLYAKAKFKVRGPYAKEMNSNPKYFDNLTLVPKGYGKVKDYIVFEYELYGFNLVEWQRSAFFVPPAEDESPKELR